MRKWLPHPSNLWFGGGGDCPSSEQGCVYVYGIRIYGDIGKGKSRKGAVNSEGWQVSGVGVVSEKDPEIFVL